MNSSTCDIPMVSMARFARRRVLSFANLCLVIEMTSVTMHHDTPGSRLRGCRFLVLGLLSSCGDTFRNRLGKRLQHKIVPTGHFGLALQLVRCLAMCETS